jgi:transcriptional regulator GlxA family with amidase domain
LRPCECRANIRGVPQPRRVVFLVFERFQSLDLTGPLEVFALANDAGGAYALEIVSARGAPVRSSSGLTITPHGALPTGAIDTLVIVGGRGVREAARDERLVKWVRAAAAQTRRVASVCTGAFLLAQAGLLDGRRATTHWAATAALQRSNAEIDVLTDPIFVRDGNVYTSAGVTAGIDLALALLQEDHGPALAAEIAKQLVLFVRRPGGQAQFSAGLAAQTATNRPIRELQQWIPGNLDQDLSVHKLAQQTYMSPRNFARVFTKETGQTPASYVEALRTERARVLLETTDLQLDAVAGCCGFGTVETLRRTFARRLRVSPSDYRERFNVIPIQRKAAG